jgi:hypothetical protein
MPNHLSKEQIAAYQRKLASPEELISADDHLAACAECKQLLAAEDWTSVLRQRDRTGSGLPAAQHLSYEQLEGIVDQTLSAEELEQARSHLAGCNACAAELKDLQSFKTELNAENEKSRKKIGLEKNTHTRKDFRWFPLRIALAASVCLLIAVIGIKLLPPHSPTSDMPLASQIPTINELPPDEQNLLREAIEKNKIAYSPELVGLTSRQGTLLGPIEHARFDVLQPKGEVVLDSRPAFRWPPLPGAKSYSVAIFDTRLAQLQTSAQLGSDITTWRAPAPLEPGRIYQWQVKATMQDGSIVIVPAPPDPEAKFRILDPEKAGALDRFHNAHLNAHIMMGILYAQAGILEMAEKELNTVLPGSSDYELAQSLLNSIREIRENRM